MEIAYASFPDAGKEQLMLLERNIKHLISDTKWVLLDVIKDNWSNGTCYYRKKGDNVEIRVNVSNNYGIPESWTLISGSLLPVDCRPSKDLYMEAYGGNNSVWIGANGEIKGSADSFAASNIGILFSCLFIGGGYSKKRISKAFSYLKGVAVCLAIESRKIFQGILLLNQAHLECGRSGYIAICTSRRGALKLLKLPVASLQSFCHIPCLVKAIMSEPLHHGTAQLSVNMQLLTRMETMAGTMEIFSSTKNYLVITLQILHSRSRGMLHYSLKGVSAC